MNDPRKTNLPDDKSVAKQLFDKPVPSWKNPHAVATFVFVLMIAIPVGTFFTRLALGL